MTGTVRPPRRQKALPATDDQLELVDLAKPDSTVPCTAALWAKVQEHANVLIIDESGRAEVSITRRGRRRRTHSRKIPFKAGEQRKRLHAVLDGQKHARADVFGTTDEITQRQALLRLRKALGDRRSPGGGHELINADRDSVWFQLPAGEQGFLRRRAMTPVTVLPAKMEHIRPRQSARLVADPYGFYRPPYNAAALALRLENPTARLLVLKDFVLLLCGLELRPYRDLHLLRADSPDLEWLPFGGTLKAEKRDCSPLLWCAFFVPEELMLRGIRGLRELKQARVRGFALVGDAQLETNTISLMVER